MIFGNCDGLGEVVPSPFFAPDVCLNLKFLPCQLSFLSEPMIPANTSIFRTTFQISPNNQPAATRLCKPICASSTDPGFSSGSVSRISLDSPPRHFMQSESQALSTAATQNSPQSAQTTSQHGIHDSDPAASLHRADDGKSDSTEQSALDDAIAASLRDVSDENRGLRTRARNTPSPPAYNRITEYEQASTPPVRKREGPGFEVIKKPRSPNDKRSPIQDLPNGGSCSIL